MQRRPKYTLDPEFLITKFPGNFIRALFAIEEKKPKIRKEVLYEFLQPLLQILANPRKTGRLESRENFPRPL